MTTLLAFKISSEFNTQIQADDELPTTSKDASNQLTGYFSSTLDKVFLFLTIGASLSTIILAALVRVHPIFAGFFFIGLIFVVFISGIASNVYQEMAADTNLVSEATQLTFISLIMSRLPIFIGVFGILLMAIMYKLWSVSL